MTAALTTFIASWLISICYSYGIYIRNIIDFHSFLSSFGKKINLGMLFSSSDFTKLLSNDRNVKISECLKFKLYYLIPFFNIFLSKNDNKLYRSKRVTGTGRSNVLVALKKEQEFEDMNNDEFYVAYKYHSKPLISFIKIYLSKNVKKYSTYEFEATDGTNLIKFYINRDGSFKKAEEFIPDEHVGVVHRNVNNDNLPIIFKIIKSYYSSRREAFPIYDRLMKNAIETKDTNIKAKRKSEDTTKTSTLEQKSYINSINPYAHGSLKKRK